MRIHYDSRLKDIAIKLIIEIDGISHHGKQGYDQLREKRLKELRFSVIRLDGYYILNHINESLEVIADRIRTISGVTIPYPLF